MHQSVTFKRHYNGYDIIHDGRRVGLIAKVKHEVLGAYWSGRCEPSFGPDLSTRLRTFKEAKAWAVEIRTR